MKPIQLGFMDNGTGKHQSNTVWYIGGVCPCISTLGSGKSCGGTQQIKILEVKNGIKVLGEHK